MIKQGYSTTEQVLLSIRFQSNPAFHDKLQQKIKTSCLDMQLNHQKIAVNIMKYTINF